MTWTDRQRAMLAEMGIPLWFPEPGVAGVAGVPTGAAPEHTASAPVVAVPVAPKDPVTPAAPDTRRAPRPEPAAAGRMAPVADAPAAVPALRPSAAPSLVDTLDWPALRDAVAGCNACGLSASRQHTVFGLGHAQAHWMIVGEAPGAEEDQCGEPFVGPSGHLLDNMLRALGLTRDAAPPERQVYIANTLKCRPPGNRNPKPEELQRCEPFLNRQIALVRPRIILAMGRFAVQSLLRSDEPIGKLRGRVHHYQGVPLIVTYHPAYLLRQQLDKAKAWDDLCLAALTLAASPQR